jgi:hypothetical protein
MALLNCDLAFPAAAAFSAGDASGSKEWTDTFPLAASFWRMSLAWLCAREELAEGEPFGGKEEAMKKG